jgi:serine/threonine protein kinase
VKMFSVYDKERRKQLHKEIKTLSSVECESLITFLGAFHKEGSIGVILEYMDRGSLEFIMEPSVRLTDLAMAAISYQVANFLSHSLQSPLSSPDYLGTCISSL